MPHDLDLIKVGPYTSETYRELTRKAGQREMFVSLWDFIETAGPLTLAGLKYFAEKQKMFISPVEEIVEKAKNKNG